MNAGEGTVPTGMLAAAVATFWRDVVLAFRRPGQMLQPVVFFLIVTTLFPRSLSPQLSQLRDISPGILWVGALLSSLLALESLFRADLEDGTLEQWVISGQPLAVQVLARILAHWTVSGLPLVAAAPLVGASLAVPAAAFGTTMLVLGLGTLCLSGLGAAGAALTLGSRRASVLLSLLVLPLAMPILIFGARGVDLAILGEPTRGPVLLLSALTILTLSLTPWAAASAVRISLE
jgi:heme exporter protein B